MNSKKMYLALFFVTATTIDLVQCEFKLRLLHNNDIHSRFQETNVHSGPCSKGPCYGGFARLKTAVEQFREEARQEGRSTIFLNAGDTYQGTYFYTFFKHKIVSELLNMMNIDVMSLGNHEFDDKAEGLAPFIANSSVPIVCCNIDYSKEPALRDAPLNGKLVPSTVLHVDGIKIGVIGYLTPETKFISQTGNVVLRDEIEDIKKEVARLKESGVNILIALGHSGYTSDMLIAGKVPDIDIVVGGHTNTFLYNGAPPSIEEPQGDYPTIVEQPSGRKVLVVQAYAYTKYLGRLDVTFNDDGEVTHTSGNPVLIDSTFEKDAEVDKVVLKYEREVNEKAGTKRIGTTKVFLEAEQECRIRECNFGNLVADAFVYASTKDYYSNSSWTDTPIAFLQGGGLRGSISNQIPKGIVMATDLLTTLPFENDVERITVSGSVLKEVLEHSVAEYSLLDKKGCFLQYSGIQVKYDLSRPPQHRVVSALVRCGDCLVPKYFPLDSNKNYTVLCTTFLGQGGDGYTMLKNAKERSDLSFSDRVAVEEYMSQFTFVYPELSGRIEFVKSDSKNPNAASKNILTNYSFLLLCLAISQLISKSGVKS